MQCQNSQLEKPGASLFTCTHHSRQMQRPGVGWQRLSVPAVMYQLTLHALQQAGQPCVNTVCRGTPPAGCTGCRTQSSKQVSMRTSCASQGQLESRHCRVGCRHGKGFRLCPGRPSPMRGCCMQSPVRTEHMCHNVATAAGWPQAAWLLSQQLKGGAVVAFSACQAALALCKPAVHA